MSQPNEWRERAARTRLVLTDCDGVLTDAGTWYSRWGEVLKCFSHRDGMGVSRLREHAGIETAIITQERSRIVRQRANKLRIGMVHLGVIDKLSIARQIARRLDLDLSEIAYIGDDVNDAALLAAVGVSACPADAEPEIRAQVDLICTRRGGEGAFREFADAILSARAGRVESPLPFHKEGEMPLVTLVSGPQLRRVSVGTRNIGEGEPVYVIAEIGINHNGSIELAKKLIDGAVAAGCDCVKFQKRTPDLCVPPEQRMVERDTPWGRLTYIDYRRKLELNFAQYAEIDRYCRERGIAWTASCWDETSVDFIARFDPPFLKVPSACLVDHDLLRRMRATGKPLMLSTGMSTQEEIDEAIEAIGTYDLMLAHATSTYPCPPRELNLRMIHTLYERYEGVPIGYSGHETGLATTCAAVSLGATFVERHVTLDRSLWGSDQAASVEIVGLVRLVRDIRAIEEAQGDGIKQVYTSELGALKRLRRVAPPAEPVTLVAQT